MIKALISRYKLHVITLLLTAGVIEIMARALVLATDFDEQMNSQQFINRIATANLSIKDFQPGISKVVTFMNEDGATIPSAFNKKGLRDSGAEYDGLKSNEKRMVVLGDSFVTAMNTAYEQSFTSVIQNRLEALNPGEWWVENMGLPGSGNGNQLLYLNNFERKGRIDHIVVCIYLGNDLRDNLALLSRSHLRTIRELSETEVVDLSITAGRRISAPWDTPIISYNIVRFVLYRLFLSPQEEADDKFTDIPIDISTENQIQGLTTSYFLGEIRSYSRTIDRKRFHAAIKNTESIIAGFKKFSEAKNAKISFVLIPSKVSVYENIDLIRLHEVDVNLGYDEILSWAKKVELDFDQPREIYKSISNKYGIEVIDITEVFRQHRNDTRLYYDVDTHWTADGQKLAGDYVASALSR